MDRKLDELVFALMQNMTIAVSGEKLACDLGISHSMLVRWIDKLRSYGLEIRGELFTGYRLTRLPDVMLPQLIRPRLRTEKLGRTLYHFYTVDSTNAFAMRLVGRDRKVAARDPGAPRVGRGGVRRAGRAARARAPRRSGSVARREGRPRSHAAGAGGAA